MNIPIKKTKNLYTFDSYAVSRLFFLKSLYMKLCTPYVTCYAMSFFGQQKFDPYKNFPRKSFHMKKGVKVREIN